jgi:hypothetical protein
LLVFEDLQIPYCTTHPISPLQIRLLENQLEETYHWNANHNNNILDYFMALTLDTIAINTVGYFLGTVGLPPVCHPTRTVVLAS